MGHIGLTPQASPAGGAAPGGAEERLLEDAKAVEAAGAFAVVVECVSEKAGELVTKSLSIPTIGMGAGPGMDGQILVYHQLLGLAPGQAPKYAKRYLELEGLIRKAFADYVGEVKNGGFPGKGRSYAEPPDPSGNIY
jgi:3-methyl-2-oxobutanoate hydroxymethyltransferase